MVSIEVAFKYEKEGNLTRQEVVEETRGDEDEEEPVSSHLPVEAVVFSVKRVENRADDEDLRPDERCRPDLVRRKTRRSESTETRGRRKVKATDEETASPSCESQSCKLSR